MDGVAGKNAIIEKICPSGKSIFLKQKSKQNKIAIVTIPLCHTRLNYSSRGDHLAAFGIQNTAQIMSDTDNRVAGPDPSGGQQLMGHIAPVNWVDFGHHRPGMLNCIAIFFRSEQTSAVATSIGFSDLDPCDGG